MSETTRIAINAQLLPGTAGGAESVLLGLISALGRLEDGSEKYIIVGNSKNPDWLKPYMGPNQELVYAPDSGEGRIESFKNLFGPFRAELGKIKRRLFGMPASRSFEVPISDGFYESLNCHAIHFPYQSFFICAIPSIFNPHDLQHLHYPQYFTPTTIAWRETLYPAGCHYAHTVAVGSNWVKRDIVNHYGISPDKIQVIPWAPPTQADSVLSESEIGNVKNKYQLEMPFVFYPAMTWEHKNHIRLLDALSQLAKDGSKINLVCTGFQTIEHWPKIESRIKELNLESCVKFLGIVPRSELRAIYKLAQFVIVPTLFEAASGPVFEAWLEGVPAACSTVTSLPEQVGDAALLFDPFSVDSIKGALLKMASDDQLRTELVKKGNRRLGDFSWERTAKAYRAVYRKAARRELSDEDRRLLAWDWMQNPERK